MDERRTPDRPGRLSEGNMAADRAVVSLFSRQTVRPTPRLRVAIIGTFAPRKCGIATFTTDVRNKLSAFVPDIDVDVYALDLNGSGLAYEDGVHVIDADDSDAYRAAARAINESNADVVWLQHEVWHFRR